MNKNILIKVKILGWVTLFWNILCSLAYLLILGGATSGTNDSLSTFIPIYYFLFYIIFSISLIRAKNWGRIPIIIANVIGLCVPLVLVLPQLPGYFEQRNSSGGFSFEFQLICVIYIAISIIPIITIWFLTRKNVKEALKNGAGTQPTTIQP